MSIIKENFIWIHIPKNAGWSIKETLNLGDDHLSIQEMKDLGNDSWGGWHQPGRYPQKDYDKSLPVACFVRNPYDRIISAYYQRYYHDEILHENKTIPVPKKPSSLWISPSKQLFERFVLRIDNDNQSLNFTDLNIVFKTQFSFISLNGQLAATHIYRYENLDEEYIKFKNQFFPQLRGQCDRLAHLNKNEERWEPARSSRLTPGVRNNIRTMPWQAYYDNKKVKEKVDELYRADFEALGYPMEIK